MPSTASGHDGRSACVTTTSPDPRPAGHSVDALPPLTARPSGPYAERVPPRGAAGNPGERVGGQVVQIQGAADSGSPRNPWVWWGGEHRGERIQHTRSEERKTLHGGPRLPGMTRRRWAA